MALLANKNATSGIYFENVANAPLTKEVEISIAGRNLPDSSLLSNRNWQVLIYFQPFGIQEWHEYTRTETIKNNRNPSFTKKINIVYRFEERQCLKFELYDAKSFSLDLIGSVEITLGNLVSHHSVRLGIGSSDVNNIDKGYLILTAEELALNKEDVELQLVAFGLDKKDFWGKSDPYLVIFKSTETGAFSAVHKTEVIKYTTNPSWNRFSIPVRTLNNGDYQRTLKIECWDWNRKNNHTFIGEAYLNLSQLLDGPLPMSFNCINPDKQKKKKKYKNSGRIEVIHCKIKPSYSFLDYLIGGTEINCTIAIDFTASNGDPSNPASFHYCQAGPTQYEQALSAVGEIIEDYDTDKQIPVLGFGARLPPSGHVSHEFHVNFNPTNPYCDRILGAIDAYRSCLSKINLFGPTNFAPVIRHVTRFARQYQEGTHYFILLILTDGIITDLYDTKEAVIDAALLPLSIIIVGIGNADFSAMNELDSDDRDLIGPSGRKAARDIVQFVPFNKFSNTGLSPFLARLQLAREVLREVPDQFLGYMKSRNISPRPPKCIDINTLPADPSTL